MDELDNLGDVDIDAANTLASTLTKTLDPEVSRLQSYVLRHMVERVSPGLIKQRLFRR